MMKKFEAQDLEQINQLSCDRIGLDTLERYTGSEVKEFQPYVLLTNFHRYVEIFSEMTGKKIHKGSIMTACHCDDAKISIIQFGIGSPLAALIVELLAFVNPKSVLFLGMCGGLREDYQVGDYFNPVAAIRGEGTSMAYLPEQCPSLSSFVIQRFVCEEIEKNKLTYHSGVIHTTNVRFWEFKKEFKENLLKERAQVIDMECATLFTVGFVNLVPIGALLLISDLPLSEGGIKTKATVEKLYAKYTDLQIHMGINILKKIQIAHKKPETFQF